MLQIHRSDIVQVIIVYRLFHNFSRSFDPSKVLLVASTVRVVTFQRVTEGALELLLVVVAGQVHVVVDGDLFGGVLVAAVG